MAAKTVYVVQAFELQKKKLVPTTKVESPTEYAAKKRAGFVAARKAGAVALALDVDTETGEVSKVTILERVGEVPDDLDHFTESF
jgi:hypothetical protein